MGTWARLLHFFSEDSLLLVRACPFCRSFTYEVYRRAAVTLRSKHSKTSTDFNEAYRNSATFARLYILYNIKRDTAIVARGDARLLSLRHCTLFPRFTPDPFSSPCFARLCFVLPFFLARPPALVARALPAQGLGSVLGRPKGRQNIPRTGTSTCLHVAFCDVWFDLIHQKTWGLGS